MDGESIRVLHVDDDPDFVELVATLLEREDDALAVDPVTSADVALDRLAETDFDCVVSDYEMPRTDGLAFLEDVRADHPDLPFILFTGKGSEDLASDAISAGITDYLQKGRGSDQYAILANRIRNAVEQFRADRRVRIKERQYRDLFDDAPIMYVLTRDEGGRPVIEDCNERFVETLGYDRDAVIGRPTTDFYADDSAAKVYEGGAHERVLAGEFGLEERTLLTSEGERIETLLRASPRLDEHGDAVGGQTLYLDVTEWTRQEERLRRERDRLAALFEDAPRPIMESEIDADVDAHRIVDVNDAFEDTFGFDREAVIGQGVPDTLVPEEEQATHERFRERVAAGEARSVEVERITTDGRRTFLLDVVPYGTDPPPADGTFATYTDITDREAYERALERQNERLEEFASVVSHDLRNPLNVAAGNVELARTTRDDERLDAAARALARTEALLEDLLTLAREGGTVETPEPVDLATVVAESWESVHAPGATLLVEAEQTIRADRSRLQQLLENLFRNAVEHGSTGGESAANGDVTVTVDDLADGSGFSVDDDGPGIPPDDRERVFEHGYSTADDGTGFGLSIVDEIADAHGWDVSVTESETGGARFEITGVEPVA